MNVRHLRLRLSLQCKSKGRQWKRCKNKCLSSLPSLQTLHSRHISWASERDIRSDQRAFSRLFQPDQKQAHFPRAFWDTRSPFSKVKSRNLPPIQPRISIRIFQTRWLVTTVTAWNRCSEDVHTHGGAYTASCILYCCVFQLVSCGGRGWRRKWIPPTPPFYHSPLPTSSHFLFASGAFDPLAWKRKRLPPRVKNRIHLNRRGNGMSSLIHFLVFKVCLSRYKNEFK